LVEGFIPPSHPRAESLRVREKLVSAYRQGIVVEEGLIAHGRGECFDYILGEKTQPFALEAEKTAAAALLLAQHPVISVNGNAAALCAGGLVELAKLVGAKIEVNLFHWSEKRERLIVQLLKAEGAEEVLGLGSEGEAVIPELQSWRGKVNPRGIFKADTVFLAVEDGDRTAALRNMGKRVIAVDLNPFSRTALAASITIVDNLLRAVPNLRAAAEALKHEGREKLEKIVENYSNPENLREAVDFINTRLRSLEFGKFEHQPQTGEGTP